jgi:hypothetical protein
MLKISKFCPLDTKNKRKSFIELKKVILFYLNDFLLPLFLPIITIFLLLGPLKHTCVLQTKAQLNWINEKRENLSTLQFITSMLARAVYGIIFFLNIIYMCLF